MNNKHQQLEKIFSRFNEAIIDFFSDIIDLQETSANRIAMMDALRLTLVNTSHLYKTVADLLFKGK
jgi:hypothetical protein